MGAKIKTQKNPLGFKQNPIKSLDQNLSPKKSHAEFPSHNKNFCIKWYNKKNRNISFRLQNSRFFLKISKKNRFLPLILFDCLRVVKYAKIRTVLQSPLNTPKNPCLNQATKKKYLPTFSYPKKSRNRKFQTPQNPSIIPVNYNPEYPPPATPLGTQATRSSKIYWLLWTWRIKMVQKPDFYTVNVWKKQISRRTLVQSAHHCWKILLSVYSWFARDITKNQTKKLSILLSFYFHEVLQHLNTFI